MVFILYVISCTNNLNKKAGDNLYEIYHNGKLVITTDANEAGAFLKNNFWKTKRQLEKTVKEIEKKQAQKLEKLLDLMDLGEIKH